MPLYAKILKSEIDKIITVKETIKFIDLLNSNKELDVKFKNYIKEELEKWLNKNKSKIIEEYKELFNEEEIEMDIIDSDEVLEEFNNEDPIKNIIDNFTDGLEQENVVVDYSDIIDRLFTNYYDELIKDIEIKFKIIKTSQLEIDAMNTIGFVKKIEEDFDMKQKMNKILSKKLDTYLDDKSEDWDFEYDPDVETILDEFIKKIITKEFILDNFQVKINDTELDNLLDYVYNSFDDLYNEIDSRIEDEKNNRDDKKSPFGPGMGQNDFL